MAQNKKGHRAYNVIKRIFLSLVGILIAMPLFAQTAVMEGTVMDSATEKPVSGASVVVKGADGKIKKFATTKNDGRFTLGIPAQKGFRIEVSAMSYERKRLAADSVDFPLTVWLAPGGIKLKEVAVRADRIREQGDTISYNVGTFAQQQDRSIGDVLKRMPGIDVDKQGRIRYQGEDINKFYIEGSDLLGGRYGVATQGINHDDVGAVEVMENHQPMQVLSGISFSDKAAINLKLKEKAKVNWSAHGKIAGGYSTQPEGALWDGELFAMAVMPTFQNMTTLRTNNTGRTLWTMLTDFFGSSGGIGLSRYIELSLPGVPSLNSNRTLMNRSVVTSVNNLKKLKNGEFKANIDYIYDRLESTAENFTTYFLPDGNEQVIAEATSGRKYTNSLSGNLIYEINAKKMFLNNTAKADVSWNRIGLATTGTLPNRQMAHLPNYAVSNSLRMINRIRDKHLLTVQSVNSWKSLPQTLNMALGTERFNQHVADHAFFTNESVFYSFLLKGLSIGLDGGVKAYFRSMNSELPELPTQLPGLTRNVINTNYTSLYVKPNLEYWLNNLDIKLNLPVTYSRYTFSQAMANRNEVYFSPSLSLDWKPNKRFEGSVSGSLGRSPMDLSLIHPALIMTDYRTFRAGVDNFYNSTSQSVSASFSYKQVRKGLFADGRVIHSWSHIPYTMSQQLIGDYAIYSYSDAESRGKSLLATTSLGKSVDFIRGSVNLKGGFARSSSHLLSQQQAVNSVSTSWNTALKLGGRAFYWLSLDYEFRMSNSRVALNGASQSWLSAMTNELELTLTPFSGWQFQIEGEHYRNELTQGNYKNMMLLDTKITFVPTKRLELSLNLSNILDKKTYSYRTYSELTSFESIRHIRGREILLTLTIRK